MTPKSFMAYENETDSFLIDDLTVENRVDRISLYGSLDITRDRLGLEHALKLKQIIDASIEALREDKNLPKQVKVEKTDTIENPFYKNP
jgi:hypothetical protein